MLKRTGNETQNLELAGCNPKHETCNPQPLKAPNLIIKTQ